jgi:hypothetical protein
MSVGFPVDKNTIDQRVAAIAWQLRNTFNEVAIIKTWIDGKTDAELIALGYSQAEADLIQAAYTDLDNLRKVATGQQQQVGTNDFFFNAKKLLGLQ